MNVVIFGKGFGKPRQINLSGWSATGCATLVMALFCGSAFYGGYLFSMYNGSGVSLATAAALESEIESQRAQIERTRQETEDTLDALALRLGQMNARVIRLDALGRRLTEMADLDEGEFDFDSTPALGGPEEPDPTGSAVAVPEALTAMIGRSSKRPSARMWRIICSPSSPGKKMSVISSW